jgi:hypothetical protein
MSERPTPETDAEIEGIKISIKEQYQLDWIAELARKLERERDEAIRQRDETNESSVFSCNFYYEEKLKAERERDEARVKMADALQEVDLRTLDYERMKQERDEAIADRDIARLAALDRDKAHDRMVGELEKVYDERDEAREELRTAVQERHDFHWQLLDAVRERDEARKQCNDNFLIAQRETFEMREAIIATLEENRHLADGDDCTLAKLKSVVPEWK